jgi:hypothetical protein
MFLVLRLNIKDPPSQVFFSKEKNCSESLANFKQCFSNFHPQKNFNVSTQCKDLGGGGEAKKKHKYKKTDPKQGLNQGY